MLDLIKFIPIGSLGGVLVNLRAEKILSKRLPDINWLTKIDHPLKRFIGFFIKQSDQFVPGFDVINIQIPMNRKKSPKSRSGHLIVLLVSIGMNSTTKVFGRNSTNALR